MPDEIPERPVLCVSVQCESVDEFLEGLSPRGPHFRDSAKRYHFYRGHSNDETFRLVPSALRQPAPLRFERKFGRLRTNGEQVRAEAGLLQHFLNVSDEVGLALPGDCMLLRQTVGDWARSKAFTEAKWPPEELLPLMALAQHSGLPTRLLDWSRSPLKAAHMAAYDALYPTHPDAKQSERLSVWALDRIPYELEQVFAPVPTTPFSIVHVPTAANTNLHAQEGVFTMSNTVSHFEDEIDRSSLDEMLGKFPRRYPWLHRFSLPVPLARKLLFELSREGVTRAHLFPNFRGVVERMKEVVETSNALIAESGDDWCVD